jgi:hypothetical protein
MLRNTAMNRRLLLASLLTISLPACTLNATSIERELSAVSGPGFTTAVLDLTDPDDALDSVDLTITGAMRADAVATGRIVGLRGSADSEDALLRGWSLGWTALDATHAEVDITTPPDSLEVWMDSLTLSLPMDRDLLLTLGSHAAHLSNLGGRVEVLSTSGSMHVGTMGVVDLTSGSGSMVVTASAGTLTSGSGNMVLNLGGWVNASTESGSIAGTIGDGGSLDAASGSIDIELIHALTRDLSITTNSGSVVVRVPTGAPMSLDLAAEDGSLSVRVEGVSHDGDHLVADVAGGGPVLSIRTGSGSIVVVDAN